MVISHSIKVRRENKNMSKELYNYKRTAKRAAKELFYGNVTIDKIDKAVSIPEIERIMRDARQEV